MNRDNVLRLIGIIQRRSGDEALNYRARLPEKQRAHSLAHQEKDDAVAALLAELNAGPITYHDLFAIGQSLAGDTLLDSEKGQAKAQLDQDRALMGAR